MKSGSNIKTTYVAVAGALLAVLILVAGTVWVGRSARKGAEQAAHSVSLLYLDELAGRREQVVEDNLQTNVETIGIALQMLTEDDLSDLEHLQAFQKRMKTLFKLEKFAFVDTDGLIYTSMGTQEDIADYNFDYLHVSGPEIFAKDLETDQKKVIIAVPAGEIPFMGKVLSACFMEISMEKMLKDVSILTNDDDVTFCNMYTRDGIPLSGKILGGQAGEKSLLLALQNAELAKGYSVSRMEEDFAAGRRGVVSFLYGDIEETLAYVPVKGTDWMLTYLGQENVIGAQIRSVSDGIIQRSLALSILMALVLLGFFGYIIKQNINNARLLLEKETSEAESRAKNEELQQRIALQEQLEEQSHVLSDALQAAEKANKAKTAFLSNMSHEIRTPMNAIIGLDNIAMNDPETTPKIRGYLEKIDESAQHLLGLINDILDMSRIESGRMILRSEEFSFPQLMESINTMFSGQCQEKGLDYQCHILGHVDDFYIGDSMKLRQVLINILGNAVKFTPEGGKVDMTVEKTAGFDGKSTIRFTIADTGIGMSKEYLPRIFDTFSQEDSSTTNKYGSSGLGLAITKNIVEMMNGDIQVESEKGKGSVFTVTVTLMDTAPKDVDTAEAKIRPGDMTVLIVDDDPVACEHARLVLEKAGIAAETADSGADALEKVKLRHARREPYNLILVDWKMPDMDGVETTRRIREIIGDASAIIILTAYRWDDVLEEALQAGVDSFISKPLFASAVLEEFQSALKRKNITITDKAHKAELTGRRVLLAEDMQVNAEIMMMVLEMRGIEAELAENGKIAVEKFASSPEGYYDAILMDMRMPEMDGLEATRTIRAMDRKDAGRIPIIALTANAFDEDVQRSLQAGLNAHLSKPVEPEILYETLQSMIRDDAGEK